MSPILSTSHVPTATRPTGRRKFIAGALIGLAGILPGASVAAEPDNAQEGTTAPGQGVSPESDQPAFDPGGDTALPFDAGPPPSGPPSGDPDDGGPVESEPRSDLDIPAPEGSGPGAAPPGAVDDPSVSPIGEPPQAPPLSGGFGVDPVPPAGGTEETSAPSPGIQSLGSEPGSANSDTPKRLEWHMRPPADPPPATTPSADYEVAAPGQSAGSDTTATAGQTIAVEATAPPTGNAFFHTVRPGESLWVIAERELGPGADAAAISAEVARLWELNAEAIGTGDPDVIMAGTKLRLR